MIALLLILIPLVTGASIFFLRKEDAAKKIALLSSLATMIISILGITLLNKQEFLRFSFDWLPGLGSKFTIQLDGMGQLLCLLTAISFPLIFISTWHRVYKNAHNFFALMMLTQAGLMGVFLAMDALVFYFFWELALIPVYFLCSMWGGEKRIAATFKFFIYTFVGSVLMLVALIYLQTQTADHSFSLASFYQLEISYSIQNWLFVLMFFAFAIKMPLFPFHTWQPDLYEQSPTATTMVLSGIMVKMGLFGVIRWLLPTLPAAAFSFGETTVAVLAVIGMIYASLLAMQQNDMKRLIAYSSIAHIGLMAIAIFAETQLAMQGVMIQMFSHGINIIGLWVIVEWIERKYGTTKFSELGGLAQKAPAMSILFVVIALANISLPLTNGFVGEFLMFSGIFSSKIFTFQIIITALAGVCIILSAVYMLRMVQKIIYGEVSAITASGTDILFSEKFVLSIIVILILGIGLYPQPILDLTQSTTTQILNEANILHLLKK